MLSERISLCPCMRVVRDCLLAMQPYLIVKANAQLTKLLNIATLQSSACLTRRICAELHVVDDRPLFTFVQSKFTVEVS